MAKYVTLKNKETKEERQFKLGFSWTCLLFGPFVPFFRDEKKYGFYSLAIFPFFYIFVNLWLAIMYNGYYVKRKYEKQGWVPISENDKKVLEDYLYI